MNALQISLLLLVGIWAAYRLGMWDARRRIRLSPQMTALLRRPTVDGVARKFLQKRGLCAYSDIMLQGETITLVCHDKALLDGAVNALRIHRETIEQLMRLTAAQRNIEGMRVLDGGVK